MHDQSTAFLLDTEHKHSDATKFNSCPAKISRLGAAAGGIRPAKAGRKFAMVHANRTHSPPKLPNHYTVDRSAKQIAAFETIYFGLIGVSSATRSERSLDQNPSQTGDAESDSYRCSRRADSHAIVRHCATQPRWCFTSIARCVFRSTNILRKECERARVDQSVDVD